MGAADFEACSAAVGDFAGGFAEEEALLGGTSEETTAATFLHEGGVVELGIESEEGEGEAILAARLSVAGAGVAGEAGEEGLDVEFEGDGGGIGIRGCLERRFLSRE